MIHSITPLGWTLIILFILFVIGVNVSIFISFKKEKGRDHWTDRMRQAGEVLRDPWKKENEQIKDLSEKVKNLDVKPKDKN